MMNRKRRDTFVQRWRSFQRVIPDTSQPLHTGSYIPQSVCSLLPESEVSRGTGKTTWLKGGHDAELEWCLVFPTFLSAIDITPATRCKLQGSIRERRLESETPAQRDRLHGMSDQSVLALGHCDQVENIGGINVSMRDIVFDRVRAGMCLLYPKENMQEEVKRTVTSSILARIPLIECIQKLQEMIHTSVKGDTSIVRVSAGWNQGSYLQERWLKYQSALTAIRGVHYSDITKCHIQYRLVTDIIERREYIQRGAAASLSVVSSSGDCVGKARLEVS